MKKEVKSIFSILTITTILFMGGNLRAEPTESDSLKGNDVIKFNHETCQLETCSEYAFETFFSLKPFRQPDGNIEIFFRLRGVADGFVALTTNISNTETEPLYMVILGSYNNKISEIRRSKKSNVKRQINTPGIISERQFRGFLIRYNPTSGGLWVFTEGTDIALLHWDDPNPLQIKFFSFATYHNRVLQVAFNCQPKDTHSSITAFQKGTIFFLIFSTSRPMPVNKGKYYKM